VVGVVEGGDVLQQVREDGVGRLWREDRVLHQDEQGPGVNVIILKRICPKMTI
jgi:hypothetical protein